MLVWTLEEDELLRARYPVEGAKGLALLWGLKDTQVASRAYRIGLKSERRHELKSDSTKSVDIHYFDIVTDSVAYMLGYIWTDGSVEYDSERHHYGLWFGCKDSDRGILEWVKSELKSKHPISRVKTKLGEKAFLKWVLAVCSKRLAEEVIKLGIYPRKSILDLSHPKIEDKFYASFARGVFDGDGCLTSVGDYAVVKFHGSERFIREFQDRVCGLVGLPKGKVSDTTSEKVKSVQWAAESDVNKLMKWMGSGGGYVLVRKTLARRSNAKTGRATKAAVLTTGV